MQEKVFIPNKKGLQLAVIVHHPEREGKFPGVLVLHGFCGYKEEEHITSLAQSLTDNGFVAVRFDASGFGESEGETEKVYRVSNYLSDIGCVYEYLKQLPYIDVSSIGICGHSMGGMLSLIFAEKHPEIKAIVAISAPAIITKEDALQDWLEEWQRNGWYEKNGSKYGYRKISYEFVEDAKEFDAEKSASHLSQPKLIILGTVDTVVYPHITERIHETAHEPKELFVIEGMDHDYKKYPDQVEKVNKKIIAFLTENL